jgi:hypothetical protein
LVTTNHARIVVEIESAEITTLGICRRRAGRGVTGALFPTE